MISILISFCILNLSLACSSTKIISYDEAKKSDLGAKHIILNTSDKKYSMHNYKFTDDSLKGELKKFQPKNGYFIHVYTNHIVDFKVNKNTGIPFEIKNKDIKKITYQKTDIGLSVLKGIGIAVGAFFIVAIIEYRLNPPDYSLNWD